MGFKLGHKPHFNVRKIGRGVNNAFTQSDKINDTLYKASVAATPAISLLAATDPEHFSGLASGNEKFQQGSQAYSSAYDSGRAGQKSINRARKGDYQGALKNGVASYKGSADTIEKGKKMKGGNQQMGVKTTSRVK